MIPERSVPAARSRPHQSYARQRFPTSVVSKSLKRRSPHAARGRTRRLWPRRPRVRAEASRPAALVIPRGLGGHGNGRMTGPVGCSTRANPRSRGPPGNRRTPRWSAGRRFGAETRHGGALATVRWPRADDLVTREPSRTGFPRRSDDFTGRGPTFQRQFALVEQIQSQRGPSGRGVRPRRTNRPWRLHAGRDRSLGSNATTGAARIHRIRSM